VKDGAGSEDGVGANDGANAGKQRSMISSIPTFCSAVNMGAMLWLTSTQVEREPQQAVGIASHSGLLRSDMQSVTARFRCRGSEVANAAHKSKAATVPSLMSWLFWINNYTQ
jgi:hypothetical protein